MHDPKNVRPGKSVQSRPSPLGSKSEPGGDRLESATKNPPKLGASSGFSEGGHTSASVAHLVPERPQFFNFDAQAVRVLGSASAPWFVAADVCRALEIERTDSALRGLEDDERDTHTVSTLGGPQEMSVVSESGLYALIFRSRKESAKIFRRWVTTEVLPQIRKTGAFAVAAVPVVPVHQLPGMPTRALSPLPPVEPSIKEDHIGKLGARLLGQSTFWCGRIGQIEEARRNGQLLPWLNEKDDLRNRLVALSRLLSFQLGRALAAGNRYIRFRTDGVARHKVWFVELVEVAVVEKGGAS